MDDGQMGGRTVRRVTNNADKLMGRRTAKWMN